MASVQGKMLHAALISQAAKKMQIEALMGMLKQAKEELKVCNATVKREKELEREHKKRMKAAAATAKAAKKVSVAITQPKKKAKKTPKNPNHKRPRGSAPKSEVHVGMRKMWDYDNGGWKEPVVEESLSDMEL